VGCSHTPLSKRRRGGVRPPGSPVQDQDGWFGRVRCVRDASGPGRTHLPRETRGIVLRSREASRQRRHFGPWRWSPAPRYPPSDSEHRGSVHPAGVGPANAFIPRFVITLSHFIFPTSHFWCTLRKAEITISTFTHPRTPIPGAINTTVEIYRVVLKG